MSSYIEVTMEEGSNGRWQGRPAALSPTRRGVALASGLLLAVSAGAAFGWLSAPTRGGGGASAATLRRSSGALAEVGSKAQAAPTPAPPPRACVELPGVRLDNGVGAVQGSGEAAAGAHECAERCRGLPDCGQAVFTTGGNGTCFLFAEAVKGLTEYKPHGKAERAQATVDVFSSAVCGSAEDMALASLRTKRQELADVQEAWEDAEKRAKEHLAGLTLQDKFALLQGTSSFSGFAGFLNPHGGGGDQSAQVLKMNDGPQGFNVYTEASLAGTTTQFPALLTVAASFSQETSRRYAAAIVEEFVNKGSNVLLGPDLEVVRVATTGRSFETLSGEDPFLGAQLAPPFVKEVQSKGIITTIKHWLDNNQEIRRMTMDVEVGDRAQHEIYMAPFKAAIDAGAGAVMCSYNKVYGTHACENPKLLKDLLRTDAGFRGFVMSDWGATHDALNSTLNGLDVEMPGSGEFLKLPQLVGEGKVDQGTIDNMAGHVLTSMYAAGQFDGRFPGSSNEGVSRADVTTDEHRDVARQTIIDGAVLLKNDHAVLPLATAGKRIAMIGKYCNQGVYEAAAGVTSGAATPFMGQGSGYVPTTRTVTPMKGLQDIATDAASVDWSADAAAAQGADVAIICASMCDVHEGWDRMNFTLPEAGDLAAAIRAQGGKTKVIVVAVAPGAVTTEWVAKTDAALLLLMPGEQVGVALAQLLTGAAAPGGRLPVTFPPDGWQALGSYPAGVDHQFLSEQYPGTQPIPNHTYEWGDALVANFTEGVLVGYRWFDANKVKPAFPFGFGLTYTEFSFDGFQAKCVDENIVISLKVTNTGKREGAAVPQLYVSFPSLLPAVRQLRGFQKLQVPSGGEADVVFVVTPQDASYYDEGKHRWVSAAQKKENVTVSVGSSSRDLLWTGSLSCPSKKPCPLTAHTA